jgi:hypothetical protein
MGGLFGQPEYVKCCCGSPLCPGCCFDLINDDQDFAPIPFEISAPSCVSIDGTTGTFTDDAIEPQNKACGSCGTFSWVAGSLTIASGFWQPDGMGGCEFISGAGLTIRFMLYCDGQLGVTDDPGLPACCTRLRLVCGTSYETTGSDADIVIGALGPYITVIEPSSCSCNPLMVVFSLCRLAPKPQTNPSPECPFAPGFDIPACDLCAVELVI